MIAGLLDPITSAKSSPVEMGEFDIVQRAYVLEAPVPQSALNPSPRLGTHVELLGYDLVRETQDLTLTLHWRIEQTLLPPHQIFVHVDTPQGVTIAQADGPPVTASGFAPTGSWLPGEYLSTVHTIALPADLPSDAELNVGLYNVDGNIRLPVTLDGVPQGDAFTIPLDPRTD